jgi:hypothetical protein
MPSEYSELVSLFLDLRGRGISLSPSDLEIIQKWEKQKIHPDLIATVMTDFATQCQQKKANFPNHLEPISRQLNKILLKMRDA